MPSKSDKQRKYIFHLRGKYGTKKNTPKSMKWIWDEEWKRLEEKGDTIWYNLQIRKDMINTGAKNWKYIPGQYYVDTNKKQTTNYIITLKMDDPRELERIKLATGVKFQTTYDTKNIIRLETIKKENMVWFINALKHEGYNLVFINEELIPSLRKEEMGGDLPGVFPGDMYQPYDFLMQTFFPSTQARVFFTDDYYMNNEKSMVEGRSSKVRLVPEMFDMKKDKIEFDSIENRRFMYNPDKKILVLGQADTRSSHGEDWRTAGGAAVDFDSSARGWVSGPTKGYPFGIIHFAPPIPYGNPEWFDKGFDTLKMFMNAGAKGGCIIRGFGNKREQTIDEFLGVEESRMEEFAAGGKSRYTGTYFQVFKNPSRGELREAGDFARGYLTKDGDLYIADQAKYMIHYDLFQILIDEGKISATKDELYDETKGLCLQRYMGDDKFCLGESYDNSPEYYEKYLTEYSEKFREKNPYSNITFVPFSIDRYKESKSLNDGEDFDDSYEDSRYALMERLGQVRDAMLEYCKENGYEVETNSRNLYGALVPSAYFSINGEIQVRISDHYAKENSGWKSNYGRYPEPDINFVLTSVDDPIPDMEIIGDKLNENKSDSNLYNYRMAFTEAGKGTDPSLRSPKKWFDSMVKQIKHSNPEYDQERINATIGKIWYSLDTNKKIEIRAREGKHYGKSEERCQSDLHSFLEEKIHHKLYQEDMVEKAQEELKYLRGDSGLDDSRMILEENELNNVGIVVTVPKNEVNHFWDDESKDIEWWTLSSMPKNIGKYIYFCIGGDIVAKAKILEIKKDDRDCEVTGKKWSGYNVIWKSCDFEKLDKPIPFSKSGFQGFRYLKESIENINNKIVRKLYQEDMVEKAQEELKYLRGDSGPDEMQDLIETQILDIVKLFASQGHSGSSASYVIPIINALLKQEIVSPLTGEDDEWVDVSELSGETPGTVYQNKRLSNVFKQPDRFNGQAYTLDGKVFSDDGGKTWFANRDSMVPIEFPYMPKDPEKIILPRKEETDESLVEQIMEAIRTDEAFDILDATKATGSDWGMGGCWILADALAKYFGHPENLVVIYNNDMDRVEHFLYRDENGRFIDNDGMHSGKKKIDMFKRYNNDPAHQNVELLQYEPGMNTGDIVRDTEASTRLAELFPKIHTEEYSTVIDEAKYQGREVTLNKPTKGDVKKYKVYVKDPLTGKIKKVNFGDKNMEIKRDDPDRRKAFRARHKCDQKKDKTTPGYWSCKFWSGKKVSELLEDRGVDIEQAKRNIRKLYKEYFDIQKGYNNGELPIDRIWPLYKIEQVGSYGTDRFVPGVSDIDFRIKVFRDINDQIQEVYEIIDFINNKLIDIYGENLNSGGGVVEVVAINDIMVGGKFDPNYKKYQVEDRTEHYPVLQNPTPEEMREFVDSYRTATGARAVIMEDGELYVGDMFGLIHGDIASNGYIYGYIIKDEFWADGTDDNDAGIDYSWVDVNELRIAKPNLRRAGITHIEIYRNSRELQKDIEDKIGDGKIIYY